MTRPRQSIQGRLDAIGDPKERARTRVSELATALRSERGWPDGKLTYSITEPTEYVRGDRKALAFDVTVREGKTVIFEDRILAWDGCPFQVEDGVDERGERKFREDPQAAFRAYVQMVISTMRRRRGMRR